MVYGSFYTEEFLEKSTKENRIRSMKAAEKSTYGNDALVLSGDFPLGEREGYFVIKKRPYKPNNDEFYKFTMLTDLPCGFRAFFREMEPTLSERKHAPPQDWLFEGMFDEIMRSMRCEVVPRDYVEKWGKEWEAKEIAKQSPAKAAQPKKSAKPKK